MPAAGPGAPVHLAKELEHLGASGKRASGAGRRWPASRVGSLPQTLPLPVRSRNTASVPRRPGQWAGPAPPTPAKSESGRTPLRPLVFLLFCILSRTSPPPAPPSHRWPVSSSAFQVQSSVLTCSFGPHLRVAEGGTGDHPQ